MYKFESNGDVFNYTEKKERKDPVRCEHEITVQERETGHQKRKSLLIEAYQTDSPGPHSHPSVSITAKVTYRN